LHSRRDLFSRRFLSVTPERWHQTAVPGSQLGPDRFLIIRSGQTEGGVGTAPNMVVVRNWFEELKRLMPAH
jgi:hypothetical protein